MKDQKTILESVLAELVYQKKVDNQLDFAIKLKTSESYLSQIMNGKQNLSPGMIGKMERIFRLSPKYLSFGDGSMFLSYDENAEIKDFTQELRDRKLSKMDTVELPVFGDNAVKGNPHGESVTDIVYQPTEMRIVARSMFEDAVAILPVYGNSMTPTHPPGSEVALMPDMTAIFEYGEVYALEIKGSSLPILKRVFPSEKEGYIQLYSDNTMKHESGPREGQFYYPPYDLPLSELKPNGKWSVVGDQKRKKNKSILHR